MKCPFIDAYMEIVACAIAIQSYKIVKCININIIIVINA